MQRSKATRGLALALGMALVAAGCGGDKNPAGPGGGGNDGPEGAYDLVALGRMGLPADVQVEDCILTRFYGGELTITENGTWQLELGFHDDNYGDATASDEGEFSQDGENVWFTSMYSGDTHEGSMEGGEVTIMYDWCYNGVPDVQLVLER